jgi:hypothetical protein
MAKMYRFYQTSEEGGWHPVVDTPDITKEVVELKARKLSILAVSEPVDGTEDKATLSYKGPLYFDIDVKGDIELAILSTRKLVANLTNNYGVSEDDLTVYCSGGKGFHVLVNPLVFSSGRAHKNLPKVYKQMAFHLHVAGLDYAVYSGGRGNCFRIPSIKRVDGNFRVPVSIEMLGTMTEASYRAYVLEPRALVNPPQWGGVKSDILTELFELCRAEAGKAPRPTARVSRSDLGLIATDAPPCVQDITSGKNLAKEKTFNQLAMQLAIYVASCGMEEKHYETLLERMADNVTSSQYSSTRAKLEHLEAQVSYMKHTPSYSFGCGAMRDCLSRRPCDGCAIDNTDSEQGSDIGMLGIEKRANGYFVMGEKKDTQISTFTIEPESVIIEVPQDGSSPRRIGTVSHLIRRGERVGSINFSEGGWASSSSFKREIEGIGNLTYTGSDQHVQLIKGLVYSDMSTTGDIFQVYTCGIHVDKIHGKDVLTYVEPGFSVNNYKVTGTHRFQGLIIAPPKLEKVAVCQSGVGLTDMALTSLCNITSPVEAAIMIGWFTACHFKTHLMTLYNQFPLLNVWGNAGSGKSSATGLVSWLNGTDYMGVDMAVSVADITPFAVLDYAASTTTVPRLMEEFNRSQMKDNTYKAVSEILKSAWNGETKLRGTVNRAPGGARGRTGAIVAQIQITSPIVYVSEQKVSIPALQERSLHVMLSKQAREGKGSAFSTAKRLRKELHGIGRYLMLTALTASLEDVEAAFNDFESVVENVPDDRPRYSYQVVMFGLSILEELAETMHYPNSVKAVRELMSAMKSYLSKESVEEKVAIRTRSEVDIVVYEMGQMAALAVAAPNKGGMIEGVHWLDMGEEVVIDPALAIMEYQVNAARRGTSRVVISNARDFVALVEQEPYFLRRESLPGFAGGRDCVVLSKPQLEKKDIDPRLFTA